MNVTLLKDLLAVPTVSWHEQPMVAWLVRYVMDNFKGVTITVDPCRNVCLTKGAPEHEAYPCVAAHLDTVQPLWNEISIVEDAGRLVGFNAKARQVGIGADDKTGIFVCLSLLKRFNNIRVIFFASEEVGCYGAKNADARFFEDVGYLIEYDCPSRNMLSYTSSGVRLFENRSDFITTALPVLKAHGTTLWQNHPYSDVMAVRRRFPISCLNLSSGYYNWHCANEFVSLADVALAIEQGTKLLKALGSRNYFCPVVDEDGGLSDDPDAPLIPIGPLHVPAP